MSENRTGKVYLVGAGPSDPGLFTRKGEAVLKLADVVVYDALVGPGIMNLIPREARKINVGKRSSNHTMPQEEISRLLVEEAKAGNCVVRLKGGDPFLFGRGGEELELLTANEIPYEVVPGVTSALSVPAYNGIPVTHRDYCSSLHIITGHKRAGASYDIDFEALVNTKGTLVFLMGIAALADICSGLLEAGMDPATPAAVLSRGTTARQQRLCAPLGELSAKAAETKIPTPAIIVVGKVCALSEEFAWYEKLPLFGKRILVTRPKELISGMAERLRKQGAEVLELPAIRIEPCEVKEELKTALHQLSKYQWLVFTSPTGVRVFFDLLRSEKIDVRTMYQAKFAVIGEGTAKELRKFGLYEDLMPEEYYGEALGKALKERLNGTEKILIPRARIGNPKLVEELLSVDGTSVTDLPIYDTVYEKNELLDLKRMTEQGELDYAVFTSASTVKGFAEAAGELDYTKITAVCIGRQTQAAAAALGMKTIVSDKATMDSVVEKIAEISVK
ncbi:MAG: uroporphyrinogen-III C-methyltransferase [Eubacteriales bacterium]|nr:uroporphyrinogen-III C-methyltransferase [Eubacteriales bacterium]